MQIDLVQQAKKKIIPYYWMLLGLGLIIYAITFLASQSITLLLPLSELSEKAGSLVRGFASFLFIQLALSPLFYGLDLVYLTIARREDTRLKMAFMGYSKAYGRIVLVSLFKGIYLFLWFLLFIIPGIIKTYAYRMTYFVMMDEPEISASQAISKSQEMMQGHKGKLFRLQLSLFILYIPAGVFFVLSLVAAGHGQHSRMILFTIIFNLLRLCVNPWLYEINADFYCRLKGEYRTFKGETVRTNNNNSFAI